MSKYFFSLVFIFILGLSQSGLALDIPTFSSPVVDEVGLLSSSNKQQLVDNLYAYKQRTGVQLQVYIINSLGGDSIDSVAIQVFDKWQLGDAKTDKGLLFLVAPNEKRMRIEVGQGLEGDVPDVIAKRIISDVVRPYFSRGEFALGISQGVSTVQNYIDNTDANAPAINGQEKVSEQNKTSGKPWVLFIIIGLWLLIFIFNPSLALYILFSAMRGGGSGGSGGGWSGGGGRSSGGGASGGW